MKPGVKSRMKMLLEQRRQAMLKLHRSDPRFYRLLMCVLYSCYRSSSTLWKWHVQRLLVLHHASKHIFGKLKRLIMLSTKQHCHVICYKGEKYTMNVKVKLTMLNYMTAIKGLDRNYTWGTCQYRLQSSNLRYHKVFKLWAQVSKWSHCLEIWQVPRQQCYGDAC